MLLSLNMERFDSGASSTLCVSTILYICSDNCAISVHYYRKTLSNYRKKLKFLCKYDVLMPYFMNIYVRIRYRVVKCCVMSPFFMHLYIYK